jgi:AraC-like DNA-binding protein
MTYVYTAAGVLILLFVVLIFQKKGKNRADYLLIGINLVIGLFLLADVWVSRGLSSANVIFQNAIPLFLFPLFVTYVLQFLYPGRGPDWRWYLIFVPGLAFVLFSSLDHFVFNPYDTEALRAHYVAPALGYQLFFKGNQLLFIGILFWILRRLQRFETDLKEDYSFIETVSLAWLRNFTLIYLVSIILTFVLFLLHNLGLLPFKIEWIFGAVYGILVLSIFYLNYQGIRHYTISQVYQASPKGETSLSNEAEKTNSPQASISASERALHQRLLNLFEEEQVYLTPKYGLRDLAADLGESPHTVSRIINSLEKKSFYDLVNSYRVEHFKKLLADPHKKRLTILALGLESGFNSKASLNRIFKGFTGLTPRQYLSQEHTP